MLFLLEDIRLEYRKRTSRMPGSLSSVCFGAQWIEGMKNWSKRCQQKVWGEGVNAEKRRNQTSSANIVLTAFCVSCLQWWAPTLAQSHRLTLFALPTNQPTYQQQQQEPTNVVWCRCCWFAAKFIRMRIHAFILITCRCNKNIRYGLIKDNRVLIVTTKNLCPAMDWTKTIRKGEKIMQKDLLALHILWRWHVRAV